MKIVIVLLFFVIFANLLIGNSYGQTKQNNANIEVFMQISLRDSDGALVGYIEGTPQIFYPDKLIDWVEQKANKSTLVKDGKRFEMLHIEDKLSWSETQTMGTYFLKLPINGEMVTVLYFHHDSFHVKSGDTAQVFWTVLRQIN